MTASIPDNAAAEVENCLAGLQNDICEKLALLEPVAQIRQDAWTRTDGLRGHGDSRVLSGGEVFERLGVNLSVVEGDSLPPSATAHRHELAGRPFSAMGVSLVIHPLNPHVPTAHMNVRFFTTLENNSDSALWWFGGGFDLTPYYGYEEDAVHWHRSARKACVPFGVNVYDRLKAACDDYFFIRHRNEPRGIGGLFFDDWQEGGFEQSFALTRSVGEHFLPAYLPIVEKRKDQPSNSCERNFQLYRRGRYVEFNLVYDRGTLFGLQSGGRVESILMSMPPLAAWEYDWRPQPGTPEARLYSDFLRPRDWLRDGPSEQP